MFKESYNHNMPVNAINPLRSLSDGFNYLFIALILMVIPLVDIGGFIMLLVAWIYLIKGFGRLSHMDIPHKGNYRNSFIIMLIALVYPLFDIVLSLAFKIMGFSAAFLLLLSIGGAAVIYLITYYMLIGSVNGVGADFSINKIVCAKCCKIDKVYV